MNSARGELPAHQQREDDPQFDDEVVAAISNAIAAVSEAPLRNSDRASATAAYEQDDEAAPRPVAQASERGESSAR